MQGRVQVKWGDGFLADMVGNLAECLDYKEAMRRLARLVVPALGDWCSIERCNELGTWERTAVAHGDPAKQLLADDLRRRFQSVVRRTFASPDALKHNGPVFVPIFDEPRRQQLAKSIPPEHYNLLKQLGLNSYMAIPLVGRGHIYGVVGLFSGSAAFTEADLSLANKIVSHAALIIDNARLYHEAIRAIRVREDTLAIVSHDLKNPLTAIELSADLLQRLAKAEAPEELCAKFARATDTIKGSTRQASRLINDLLDWARVDSGNLRVETQPEHLSHVLAEALEVLAPGAKANGTHIQTAIAEPAQKVHCDRARVIQVFSNLIGNAIKFAPKDEGKVNVSVLFNWAEAEIRVEDNGPGIPPHALPYIFDRYWQPEESKRNGTGLGLAISKGIIEAHQGSIWAENPEVGARLVFTLPIAHE